MRLALMSLACAALLAGCGGDDPSVESTGAPAQRTGDALEHIHGLGVSDGDLYIATHSGLWTAPSGQREPRRLGKSRQDIMGFSLIRKDRFLGSGHPDPADSGAPPNLGLIESRDGGRTWRSISLRGQADFHVLEASGDRVYGVNSADGRLLASADGGRTWAGRTPPAAVFGLAIDPGDPRHVAISTERGVFSSRDAGRRWRPRNDGVGGLLAWPRADALYLVGGDGGVHLSSDGGRRWQAIGTIGGPPAALIADGDDLYAALHDGSVKVSTDGGKRWAVRAAPSPS